MFVEGQQIPILTTDMFSMLENDVVTTASIGITDANSLIKTGIYFVSITPISNTPTTGGYWLMTVIRSNASRVVQIAIHMTTNSPIFAYRVGNGINTTPTWTAWKQVTTTDMS